MEIASLFNDPMTQPTVRGPAPLREDATEDDKMIRNEKLKIYAKKTDALEQNLITVHTIIWGQTSPTMQTKIKLVKDYETKTDNHDCLWLIQQIEAIAMNYESKKNPMMSKLEAKEQFYACKQDHNESSEDYMYKLKAWADVVKHCGRNIAGNWENIPEDFGTQEAREEAALDYTLAIAYIKGVDWTRYGVLAAELRKMFTKRQVCNADLARELYCKIGRPGEDAFEDILQTNKIHNCSVTVDDTRRAVTIYGPDIPKLKGTTTTGCSTCSRPKLDGSSAINSVIQQLCYSHNRFCYVNKIPFLTTICRNIGWHTIAPVPNQQNATILKELNHLTVIYRNRGLPVNSIHDDNEFACIRDDIGSIHLDIAAPNTDVPEIERSN